MKKPVLSKKVGWVILILLVLIDGFLDMFFANNSGLQSFFWKPISEILRIKYAPLTVPIVLIIFYILVKIGAFLEKKIDKVPFAEELVLTTLVIVYGLFVFWLFLVYFLGFSLIKNHLYLIFPLILVGTIYSWWAEKKLKRK